MRLAYQETVSVKQPGRKSPKDVTMTRLGPFEEFVLLG